MINKVTVKRVLPTVLLAAILVLLIGLAFLPAVRGGNEPLATVQASADDEAMRLFRKCAEYSQTHSFRTRLNGNIKARVLGLPYNVKVSGGREVNGGEFCDITEGVSAAVKIGKKKSFAGGTYSVARGEYKDGTFVYGEAAPIDEGAYLERFGYPPTELVKYAVESSIVNAECRDENIYVYTLDAGAATEYYRREGRTVLGCEDCPTYTSVVLTLVTDGERAIKITAEEKFTAPKFGGIECKATFTEMFEYD